MWIFCTYVVMSLVTFVAFACDKRAARLGRCRTPERLLHVLELLGGFPGAMFAQRMLRHKSYKLRYRLALWAIAALHILAWGVFLWLRLRGR